MLYIIQIQIHNSLRSESKIKSVEPRNFKNMYYEFIYRCIAITFDGIL